MTTFFIIYSILTTLMLFGIGVNKVRSSTSAPALEKKKETKQIEREEKTLERAKSKLRKRIFSGYSPAVHKYFDLNKLDSLVASGEEFVVLDVFDFSKEREGILASIREDLCRHELTLEQFTKSEQSEIFSHYVETLTEYTEAKMKEIAIEHDSMRNAEQQMKPMKTLSASTVSVSASKTLESSPELISPKDEWEDQFGELNDLTTEEDAR